MYLIITEKETAAKRIAAILAEGKVKRVRYPNLGIETYEFSYKEHEKTIVMGLSGHIVGIDFPKKYNNWQKTDAKELIDADIRRTVTNRKIVNAIRLIGKEADKVTIATDYDREGELIGVEALELIQEVNPNVKFDRALYSALTPKDIKNAFENLTDVDFALAGAGHSREIIDLVWGAALTRHISLSAGRLGKLFLSVGRVQSPTLALIVEREKEREAFVPVPYSEIEVLLETDKKERFLAEYKTVRIYDKKEAMRIFSKVSKSTSAYVVSKEEKERKEKPPIPFNTTEFYVAANSVGITVNSAKRTYQTLYESGYLSYPRTDSTIYPDTLDLKALIEMFVGTEFDAYAKELLAQPNLVPTTGKKTDPAHPPLHPVSVASKKDLKEDEWKIYELVVRRFFATFSNEARWATIRVQIDIEKEMFRSNGSRLIDEGWRRYYPYNKPNDRILPEMYENDKLKVIDAVLHEKETQPPSRYGQGRLIRVMDELGLGTKATRADIINKLVSRYYIHGNPLQPTKTAFAVVDTLEKYSPEIVKPDMTKRLEEDMDKISEGKIDEETVLKESRDLLLEIFEALEKNSQEVQSSLRSGLIEDKTVGRCNLCGSDLTVRRAKRGGRFIGCNGYPDCNFALPLPSKGQVIVTDKMCEEHNLYKIKIITSGKRPWELGCPQCNFEEWEKTQGEKEKDVDKNQKPVIKENGSLTLIPGIGITYEKKLNDIGIKTAGDLKKSSASEISKNTGIPKKRIQNWQNSITI